MCWIYGITLADISHRVIREAVRHKLVEGITLDCKYFNLKSRTRYRYPSDVCARVKMHRISLPTICNRLVGLSPGLYVSAEVFIILNIPFHDPDNRVGILMLKCTSAMVVLIFISYLPPIILCILYLNLKVDVETYVAV